MRPSFADIVTRLSAIDCLARGVAPAAAADMMRLHHITTKSHDYALECKQSLTVVGWVVINHRTSNLFI